jgi:hypothetical protein
MQFVPGFDLRKLCPPRWRRQRSGASPACGLTLPRQVAQFQEALRLHPDFPEVEENVRAAKQSETTNGHQ